MTPLTGAAGRASRATPDLAASPGVRMLKATGTLDPCSPHEAAME